MWLCRTTTINLHAITELSSNFIANREEQILISASLDLVISQKETGQGVMLGRTVGPTYKSNVLEH